MRWWWAALIIYKNILILAPTYITTSQTVTYEKTQYLRHQFFPKEFAASISSQFKVSIEKKYVVASAEAILGTYINFNYHEREIKVDLSKSIIDNLNAINKNNEYIGFNFKYGVNTVQYGLIKQFQFWIEINGYKEFFNTGWGNYWLWIAASGIWINVKLNLFNWLEKKWDVISAKLHNKEAEVIDTGDVISGNSKHNQELVLKRINKIAGMQITGYAQIKKFYENFVEITFREGIDNYEINKKIRFYFKYVLADKYLNLQNKLENIASNLEITTTVFSLTENKAKIKSAIKNRLGSIKWGNYYLKDYIENYNFIPARDSFSQENVDVYFNIPLADKTQLRMKKLFNINFILDNEYYIRNINDRVVYESKSNAKKIILNNQEYWAYEDDVYIKFRVGIQENEILMINNRVIGVNNFNFNYVMLDKRFDNDNGSDSSKIDKNIYNVKITKKVITDGSKEEAVVTYEKNIIIIKGIIKIDIDAWAKNDDQNLNQINKTVIYNEIIDNNFLWDRNWLRKNEDYLLQNINSLSVSLLAFKKPRIIDENLAEINNTVLSFKNYEFSNYGNEKINFNSIVYDSKQSFKELTNFNEYFSKSGIYQMRFKNILNKDSIYYHINLGKHLKNNFDNEAVNPINYINNNIYYFWNSVLGRGLINYLRGASWYIDLKTNQVISWKEYQNLTTLEKLDYVRQSTKNTDRYDAKTLLEMPVETIHFYIMRMISDLQYDTGGILEEKIKEGDNGGQEELKDEIKIKECKDKCKEDLEKLKKEDEEKGKKEKEKQEEDEKIWKDKKDMITTVTINNNTKRIRVLLAIALSTSFGIVLIGTIIFFRRKKRIK